MDDPPRDPHAGEGSADAWSPTIALGLDDRRNRELLAELLTEYETVRPGDAIGADVDLCVVDPPGFGRLSASIERWRNDQSPAAAPGLLLGTAPENDLWREYADAMGRTLDAVQSIPAPKRAVLARIEGLLEMRRYSLTARWRHERLELYERAMDGANLGITIADATDPDHPLVYVNEGFEQLTGYPAEEALGRNCRFLQGERTDPSTVDRIREALDAEETVSVEIVNYRRSGEPFWNDLDIVPVEDASGEVTHFLGFQEDVTERREREADLERYEQVLQSLDDPVVVVDARRRIELSNEAAGTLFGAPEGIPEEADVPSLFPPEARDDVRDALGAVQRTGEPRERQFVLERAGEERIYQFRFQRERSGAGRPLSRIVVIGRDVTTLREYQNRLSVLDRVLRHNLRNKLNVVAGNTELLTEGDRSPETVAAAVARIDDAVEDLLGLAESARQFHRSIEPGSKSGTPVDLGEIVAAVAAATAERYPDADIEADAPGPVTAIAPPTLRAGLEQLVENAIVYADRPCPTVRIELDDSDPDTVEIRVADDGPGIPAREREALSRGAETSLEHLQGISLWLVNWAVRSVGGEFEIRDNEPSGTVVSLRLPRC